MAAFIPSSGIALPSGSQSTSHMVSFMGLSPFDASHTLLSNAAPALPSGETFEPILPDTSTVLGFTSIVLLSALCVFVWSNQVVPVSRTNLAIAKKQGPLKEYLEDLREGANSTETSDGKDFERWLFTDWLQKPVAKGGRQKEPALPILKSAKWNSGDNPVLVASALIGAGVIFTSVAEKITSFL